MISAEAVRDIQRSYPIHRQLTQIFRPHDFVDGSDYVHDPVQQLQMASLGYRYSGSRIGVLEGRILDRDVAHDVADAMKTHFEAGLPHLQAVLKDRRARATGEGTTTFMWGGEQLVAGPFLSDAERRYHDFIGAPLLENAWEIASDVYKAIQEG